MDKQLVEKERKVFDFFYYNYKNRNEKMNTNHLFILVAMNFGNLRSVVVLLYKQKKIKKNSYTYNFISCEPISVNLRRILNLINLILVLIFNNNMTMYVPTNSKYELWKCISQRTNFFP